MSHDAPSFSFLPSFAEKIFAIGCFLFAFGCSEEGWSRRLILIQIVSYVDGIGCFLLLHAAIVILSFRPV